jgi:hypothetical protein
MTFHSTNLSFIPISFYGTDRGKVFIVANPFLCHDFDHMVNAAVEINGHKHLVIAVERFLHAPPWATGEPIGLLVKEIVLYDPFANDANSK